MIYVHDRDLGVTLLANQAWFAIDDQQHLTAFLLKDTATRWAQAHHQQVLDFVAARGVASSRLASAR